jgi:hypothetical protein
MGDIEKLQEETRDVILKGLKSDPRNSGQKAVDLEIIIAKKKKKK